MIISGLSVDYRGYRLVPLKTKKRIGSTRWYSGGWSIYTATGEHPVASARTKKEAKAWVDKVLP